MTSTVKIPEGWIETTLKSVCVKAQDKINVSDLTNETYISTENMLVDKGGITTATTLPTITNVSKFFPGDILFSNIRTYFKKLYLSNFTGGCSNDVLIFRANKETDNKFLFYNLSQDAFFDYTVKTSKGTKMPRGDKNAIEKFPIILPPLQEQKAIAGVLSAFDDKIELLRAENQTLEEMGQTLFKERFISPLAPGRGNGTAKNSSDSKKEKSPSGDLGAELPDGWKVGKLGDIADIYSGKRPQEISENKKGNFKIPLIGATKIMGFVDDYLFEGKTLVIGRVGTHGIIQTFYNKIYPSDNTLVIKSDNFYFTYFILKHIDYEKLNRGAVQPLITQGDLNNYGIILPTKDILEKFNSTSNSIFTKIKTNSEEIESLSNTRDQLLPKLMSGEVRVEF